jgi:hypothetical protein
MKTVHGSAILLVLLASAMPALARLNLLPHALGLSVLGIVLVKGTLISEVFMELRRVPPWGRLLIPLWLLVNLGVILALGAFS